MSTHCEIALWPRMSSSPEKRIEVKIRARGEEVARRMEDLHAGKAVTVPWEELHQELLAMLDPRLGTRY